MKEKQRTLTQNRALHKYFEQVATEARTTGVTFSDFIRLRPKFEMQWSPERVKEVWRGVQELMYGKKSTAQLTSKEIDQVYDVVNKGLGEIMGFNIPFPSEDDLRKEK